MKKNLLSVLILALLVVNIALTSIMMFGMMGSLKNTSSLVGKIAAVLDLELDTGKDETEKVISIEDTVSYDIAETMTIPLKSSETDQSSDNATQHYAKIAVSIQMDKNHEDYKKHAEGLAANESLIRSEIISVVSSYTVEEFLGNTDGVCKEILSRLQKMYGSDFIYKVVISDMQAY